MLPQLSKQCMFVAILRMFAAVTVGVKLFMMSAGFVAMQVSLDLGSRVWEHKCKISGFQGNASA